MTTPAKKQAGVQRRDYNAWVATETLEDYALRYAPKSFRKWSECLIANTALGGISFLALEAIGGSLVINYGFTNAIWAIGLVSLIIFLTGIPICYYAAKYNIDMDLLTRGAGFGYVGSTITSLKPIRKPELLLRQYMHKQGGSSQDSSLYVSPIGSIASEIDSSTSVLAPLPIVSLCNWECHG